ncbi:MAG TPA: hypothetical protein VEK56_00670 [Vicinamibacterales bacterium]|nr:hypothetical protein [Vicinamibacterales bacterium]
MHPATGEELTQIDELATTGVWLVALLAIAAIAVPAFWRVQSAIRIRRAGERPMHSTRVALWRPAGRVDTLDLAAGPGGRDGAPLPPFTFVEEHLAGTRPCVSLRDARGRAWRVKWGDEVQVEALATRLAWAAGYFVETTYFVRQGRLEGLRDLTRASSCFGEGGVFQNARFELEEEMVIKHFDEHSWAWNDNPFIGTRELNGLKIVMMWLSNWDAKDVRDVARGSNTAVFEYPTRQGHREARYLITDWGGALGRWGNVVNRGRWDCAGFTEQTPHFVEGVDGEFVRWGYSGQRTADIADGIRVSDVRWLVEHVGALKGSQIGDAVRASGGTPDEIDCFTGALTARLDQLRMVARGVRTFSRAIASN